MFEGVSHYGVGDLEALAKETHKFESRYLDSMIAPYTPENRHIYIERSPFHHIERFSCPIAFFQGDEDKVKDCVLLFQIGCCQVGFVVCLWLCALAAFLAAKSMQSYRSDLPSHFEYIFKNQTVLFYFIFFTFVTMCLSDSAA